MKKTFRPSSGLTRLHMILPGVLLLLCAGHVSCSDDPITSPGFQIDNVSSEVESQIPFDRTICLFGTGFQSGDVIRLTETGLSRHYYKMETRLGSARAKY